MCDLSGFWDFGDLTGILYQEESQMWDTLWEIIEDRKWGVCKYGSWC